MNQGTTITLRGWSSLCGLVVRAGIVLLLCVAPAWAQTTSISSVTGRVTDEQGAVLVSGEVTLTDAATGVKRTAKTNEVGRYAFVSVDPGTYDISVSLAGFQTTRVSAQKVTVGQQLTIDVTLAVGGIIQSIEVSATGAAQLQTTTATVGATITGDTVVLLPNLSRDAYALQTLNVGETPAGEVAGTRNDQNTYLLDGGNVTDDNSGNLSYNPLVGLSSMSAGVMPTPVESVEEFKMGTSNQTADFANSAGSQVQMVTRRGTNQWHGTAYEFILRAM